MKNIVLPLSAALFTLVGTAQAKDVELSGFASFIGGIKNEDGDHLLYESDDLNFQADSLVGVQLRQYVNDKVSTTVQLLARGVDDWNPEIDWAYLSYEQRSDLTWRVGRLRLPFYLYSDYLSIGYSYPWIAPPYAVYYFPVTAIDGGDIVYTFTAGDVDIELQTYAGTNSIKPQYGVLEGMELETRNQFGAVSEFSWEAWSLRLAYHRGNVYIDFADAPLGQALEAVATSIENAGYPSIADDLRFDGDVFEFANFALQYDDSRYLMVFESNYVTPNDHAPIADNFNYFLTGAIRQDAFLYHLNYSREKDIGPDITSRLPASSPFYDIDDEIRAGFARGRTCWTLGMRWDFIEQMTFKAEVLYFPDMGPTPESARYDNMVLTRFGIQTMF